MICRADDHKTHRKLLQTIQTNAKEVQRNAAIFQWTRVNREVDRIVADEKKLHKTMVSHTELKSQCDAIKQTVSSLRSARLKRDSERAADAAKKLVALTTELLKKEAETASRSF